jgi:ferredoxin-NADP reductase
VSTATLTSQPTLKAPRTLAPWQKLIAPLVTPDVFDFWAGQLNRSWSWSTPMARITERRDEARDTVTLVLRTNRHCADIKPGQHVMVGAQVNGRLVSRSYSPSCIDTAKGLIEITVKRVEGGALSTHLCRDAQVGEVLTLGQVFGDMVWPRQAQGGFLFLAAGSGITPFMALIRDHAARGRAHPVHLIYWARTRADLCFVNELRQLSTRVPLLHCEFVLTDEPGLGPNELSGMISADQIQRMVPDLNRRHVRICGPAGFVDTARELTQGRAQSVVAEGFTPPLPTDLESLEGEVTVTLQRSGRQLFVPRQQSLLDALEAQGLKPASGCRMGVCHTCVCPRVQGQTQDMLTGERQSEGMQAVRLCVSRACTDLTLDI